jgi:hypothetical protein
MFELVKYNLATENVRGYLGVKIKNIERLDVGKLGFRRHQDTKSKSTRT